MADIILNGPPILFDTKHNNTEISYTLSRNDSISNGTKTKNVADAEWDKDTRIIILWIQIILGFIGGFAVCGWLWYNRSRKSRVNVVMLHVTISDLLVMVATLTQVMWEMVDRWWLAGDAFCRIIKFYQSFSMMASSYMLVLLSIDRHQAIRSPLRDPPTVWKLALPLWIGAALLSIPMFFLFHVITVTDKESIFYNMTTCESVFRTRPLIERQIFSTFISIVHIFVPCIVIAVCYIRIFLKISEKAEEAAGGQSSLKPGKIHLQSTGSSCLPKAKIKTLKMTIVIVSMFVLCGLPYHILEMLYNFWEYQDIPKIVASILGALAVSNSVANPYIFLVFNTSSECAKDVVCHNRQSEYHNNFRSTTGPHTARTTINTKHSNYSSTAMELTPIHRKINNI